MNQSTKFRLLTFLLSLLLSSNVFGISYVWNGSVNSSWNVANNWTPVGIPTGGDDVTINIATPALILDNARTIQSLAISAANTLNLGGFQLNITGSVNVTNGTINNGTIFSALLTSFNWQNTITSATINVRSETWGACSNNTFNGPVTVIHAGTTNQTFGSNNTVNARFTFINENNRFRLDPNGGSTYNGDSLILINLSGVNESVFMAQSGSNVVNCPIRVASTSNGDLRLGANAGGNLGSVSFGPGVNISTSGFINGNFFLQNCKQTDATNFSFTLPVTAGITFADSCLFLGNVVVEGRGYNSDRCRYEGTASFTKIGATNENLGGGNYFLGTVTIVNNGSGDSNWGSTRADTFASNITITNSGIGGADIRIAQNNAGHFIAGNVTITNNSAAQITLAENGASTLRINGNVEINSLTGNGISIGGGVCQLPGEFFIGAGGFLSGGLTIRNTTFSGLLPISLNLDPAAGQFVTSGSNYLRNLTVVASGINVTSSIFQANASFHKTGGGNNTSVGGNYFSGNLNMILSGNGTLTFGNSTADTVMGNLSITNTGASTVTFANNSMNNFVNGTVLFLNSANGSCQISNGANARTLIQGIVSLENTGTGTIGFGISGGFTDLALSSTLQLTATGISSGTLSLRNINHISTTAINLPTTGGTISFNNAQFAGDFSSTAGGYAMINSRFLGNTQIVKTGAGNNNLSGGNRFFGNLSTGITGPNYLLYGNLAPDTVDGNLTLTNSGTERTIFAHNTANHIIGGDVIVQNNGTNGIWLGYNPSSTVAIGGNILLENNSAAGVFIGTAGGVVTLAATRNLQTTGLGFNGGTLNIANLVQNGIAASTLVLTGTTATLNNCDFGGGFDLEATRLTANNCIFRQNCRIIKTGAAQDVMGGNNRFLTDLTTGITANGNLIYGNATSDTVVGNLTLLNTGSAIVYFANNSPSNHVSGNLTASNTGIGSISISNGAPATLAINGNIFLENDGGAGVIFGAGAGSTTLATGSNISLTGTGFNAGTLQLRNFIQNGNVASTLLATGTSSISIIGATLGGALTTSSANINFQQSTFEDATFTKTTGGNQTLFGGNTFNGNLTLNNQSNAVFILANNQADTYGGDVTLTNSGTGQIRLAENTSVNTIAGNLTFNNQSTGLMYVGNGTAAQAAVLGNTILTNAGGGSIFFNNGNGAQFSSDGNLEISSPNGGTINLGNASNNTTFASPTASINLGGGGFNNSTINCTRVVKTATTAINLITTGTSSISFVNSNLRGTITTNSANINFQQSTFDDANFTKTAGGGQTLFGGNTFSGNLTFANLSNNNYILSNNQADTVLGNLTLINSGSAIVYFANNSPDNLINGNLTASNTGTGSISISNGAPATLAINGNIFLENDGGAGVIFGAGAGSTTLATGSNISLTGTGFNAGTLQLRNFIQNGNVASTLFATGTSSITIIGATLGGALTTSSANINFQQSNFTDATFTKTAGGNQTLFGGNTFNGNLSFTNLSNTTYVFANNQADTYGGNVTLTNSGTGQIRLAESTSLNTIAGNLTFNNQSTGLMYLGNGALAEVSVTGNTTLNNLGGGSIFFNNGNGAQFNSDGNLEINSPNGGTVNLGNASNNTSFASPTASISLGAGGFNDSNTSWNRVIKTSTNATSLLTTGTSAFTINNSRISGDFTTSSNSVVVQTNRFLGDLSISKTGTINNVCSGSNFIQGNAIFNILGVNYLMMGNGNADTIQGNMTVNLSGDGAFYYARAGADHRIDGNVFVNSTGTGIVYFSEQATATLNIGGNITLECAACGGVRFTPGVTTQSAGGAILTGAGGIDAGSFNFRNFTQLGSAANTLSATGTAIVDLYTCSFGGNFDINAPRILMRESTFAGTTNFTRNSGTNDDNFGGNTFTGNSILTNNGPAARWLFGNAQPDAFGGDATFINTNTGSIRVAFNVAGTTIAGNTTLRNTSTGSIFLSENVGTATLSGNLVLENPNGGLINIGNNGSATAIQAGGNISIGGAGFADGSLSIRALTLNGTVTTNLITTGNTNATINGCTFGGNLVLTSGQWTVRETNVNGNTSLTKTQPGNNISAGGNTFGGTFTMTHNSTDLIRWGDGTALPDVFVGNVLLQNNSTGTIELGRNNVTDYRGNISYASANAILFGANVGSTVFNGSGDQTISDISGTTPLPTFRRVTVNKPSGSIILNTPVDFGVSLAMNSGIIQTTNTNILRLINATTLTGGNTASYVNGPMIKVGNQAFDFPVGKGGIYAPISISAAGVTTDQFRAEYFNTSPNTLYPNVNRESSIDRTSGCEYWNLDRLVGTAARFVTIGWADPRSCGVNDFNQLLVARWNGTQWINEGGANYTGNNTAGTLRSVNAIGAFSPFTLGSSIGINPLPITGISLKAKALNRSVHLQWTPEGEYNHVKFELQRASSNGLFQTIHEEEFSADPSAKREFFEFLDEHAPSGNLYYRVIAWEGDQKTLSKNEFVYIEPTETSIYPNLLESGESINIFSEVEDLNAVVSLQMINGVSSEVIKTGLAAGEQSIYLGDRAPGVYFLLILSPDAGTQIREKIVIR